MDTVYPLTNVIENSEKAIDLVIGREILIQCESDQYLWVTPVQILESGFWARFDNNKQIAFFTTMSSSIMPFSNVNIKIIQKE